MTQKGMSSDESNVYSKQDYSKFYVNDKVYYTTVIASRKVTVFPQLVGLPAVHKASTN
jgi:ribosomal protein S19